MAENKQIAKSSISPLVRVAALLAIIGFIIYIVSATTGYMAGRSVNAAAIAFSLIAICGLVVLNISGGKVSRFRHDLLLFVSGVCLMVGLLAFVMDRVSIFADIYFLPVNYPASEQLTSNVTIAGLAIYVLAILMLIVAGFQDRPREVQVTISVG